jgi:4'-phosphopantetheinyl transferase
VAAEVVAFMAPAWACPPDDMGMGDREIHIWRAALDWHPAGVESIRRILAEDEKDRAERFFFSRDRDRFIVGRAVLRLILGRYLRVAPEGLHFWYNRYGKPALRWSPGGKGLNFSVSHSGELAVYAVSLCGRRCLGVDIERIRQDVSWGRVAEECLSLSENTFLRSLPGDLARKAFFQLWTRKEAHLKAKGCGLYTLDDQPMSPSPGMQWPQGPKAAETDGVPDWRVKDFCPREDYAGAVAADGHEWSFSFWHFPE